MAFSARVLSVFELNEYVRKSLAADPLLRGMQLRGEISNMKCYASGHWYFSLKDDQSRINCVMFRQYNYLIGRPPADGESVVLSGSVSLYTKDGNYQFYAESIRKDGLGVLYANFLELKAKLEAEGLFDPSVKKPIPLFPRRIGIVTSQTGAVIHDIINVSLRRNNGLSLVLYPAKVQGDGAAQEIIEGIQGLNALKDVDVIIIGRGGGSMEDLWAFNDERLARAIRLSRVPVVSAVGHETDFTIADFAADVRAATPSQAAEICVQDKAEMKTRLSEIQRRMDNAAGAKLHALENKLASLKMKLVHLHPDMKLLQREKQLTDLSVRLGTACERNMAVWQERIAKASVKLFALSPNAVLERGYALAYSQGHIVTDISSLYPGGQLQVVLKNGKADTIVKSIEGANING